MCCNDREEESKTEMERQWGSHQKARKLKNRHEEKRRQLIYNTAKHLASGISHQCVE